MLMNDVVTAGAHVEIAAIERLIADHAELLDHARWHEVAELYTEDGRLEGVGPRPLVGHDAFHAWAAKRAENSARRTHHQCTNIRVDLTAEDKAVGTVMLVLHVFDENQPEKGVVTEAVGEYLDDYLKIDGRWRFTRRRLVPIGPRN